MKLEKLEEATSESISHKRNQTSSFGQQDINGRFLSTGMI